MKCGHIDLFLNLNIQMTKRIEIDGKFYRKRRDRLVEIPEEWVSHTINKQTIRKRKERAKSKLPRHRLKDGTYPKTEYRTKRHAMIDEEA